MASTVFSTQLQNLRKRNGITQEQLAQRLGVSPQAVSKWENGSYPDGDLLPKLADFFGVSIDHLYGRGKKEVSLEQRIIDELHELQAGGSEQDIRFVDKMFDIIWAMQLATWQENRYWYGRPDIGIESGVTASSLTCGEGFTFLRLNKDLQYYFWAKTPENGFSPRITDPAKYSGIFSFMGDKTNLKVLLFMLSLRDGEFVKASTVADRLEIPVEKAKKALSELSEIGKSNGAAFPEFRLLNEQFDSEPCYGKAGYRTILFMMLLIVADSVLDQPMSYQLQVGHGSDWIDREKLGFLKKE